MLYTLRVIPYIVLTLTCHSYIRTVVNATEDADEAVDSDGKIDN